MLVRFDRASTRADARSIAALSRWFGSGVGSGASATALALAIVPPSVRLDARTRRKGQAGKVELRDRLGSDGVRSSVAVHRIAPGKVLARLLPDRSQREGEGHFKVAGGAVRHGANIAGTG